MTATAEPIPRQAPEAVSAPVAEPQTLTPAENPEQARQRLALEQRARGISSAKGPSAGLRELAKGDNTWGTAEPEGTTGAVPDVAIISAEAIPQSAPKGSDAEGQQLLDSALSIAQKIIDRNPSLSPEEKLKIQNEQYENARKAFAKDRGYEATVFKNDGTGWVKVVNETSSNDTGTSDPDTQEPQDQRPIEVRITEAEATLLEASLKHLNATKSGDAVAIAEAENEVKEAKAKYDALNAENDAAINAEQADARPLEERLDEARHEMDKLAREILDAESRGDLNARNEAQVKHLLLAAKYKGLLEEGDKDFQKKYLEKVEKEGKKKGKGPLWFRLLKIFGLGTTGALTPVLSDLKDAAEGPPRR